MLGSCRGEVMPHFFISYAKKDTRELAIGLNDALNTVPNITAWVDISMNVGQSWETQIQREINKCDYFVVLYSPDLNRHLVDETLSESYVLTEIAYAKYTLKKRLIPIMAQKTTPPMSLTTLQYIDFTLTELRLNDLVELICDEVGIEANPLIAVDANSVTKTTNNKLKAGGKKPLDTLILDYFKNRPNEDIADDEWVKVISSQYKTMYGKSPRDPWRAVRSLHARGYLIKIDKGIYRYDPEYKTNIDISVKSILPHPFEWCEIPEGKVRLEGANGSYIVGGIRKNYIIPTFSISKYPITNAQFSKFLEAGGYQNKKWWTIAGWERKEKNKEQMPPYWQESWEGADFPVVEVSWYEAIAFCAWLSETTG
jgi:hypothetical protein